MLEHELKINPEFEEIIPPISPDEFTQLEDNIVAEGELLMPIIIWKGFIIDGHSRYKILQKHPEIECKIIEKHFEDKYEAIAWICKNQIGGRNLSERYIKYLRGKQYEAEKKSCKFHGNQYTLAKESGLGYFNPDHNIHGTRTALAEKNGVSESMIVQTFFLLFGNASASTGRSVPVLRRTWMCAQIGRCAKQLKVLPHTAVCEIICLTD